MLRRLTIILDCLDPHAILPFWREALGYVQVWENEDYIVLADEDGEGPVFALQRVPEEKAGKNRMHIDFHAPDLDAEFERMSGLGATKLSEGNLGEEARWFVLADPAGNEFCIVSP